MPYTDVLLSDETFTCAFEAFRIFSTKKMQLIVPDNLCVDAFHF